MFRSLIRPSYRWGLVLCLMLVAACGKKAEEPKPAPALTREQATKLRHQVEELREQAMDLSSQINDLRRQHMAVMSELTSQSQQLAKSLNSIDSILQGKMVSIAIRPTGAGKGAAADHARGPIGPFARFLLIVIILCAIWVLARLFLKHLSEDEEEEDDELAPDEEPPAPVEAQTPAPTPAPEEVKNPLADEPQSQNNESAEHKE